MTLTDAMIGAAALWLLFVACGAPGHRAGTPAVSGNTSDAAAHARAQQLDVVPYSVWHQDDPQPRYVTPPLPAAAESIDDRDGLSEEETVPENVYSSLGSTAVSGIGMPQVLSLTEVTIEPGSTLTLVNLGGSGLIVLQSGWLELAERDGNAVLTRSPGGESPGMDTEGSLPTIGSGDHLSFGPGATIVLRNRGEHPARILTASVLAIPGLAA